MFVYSNAPRISALSTRYVRCTVSATDQGTLVDPTSGTVFFAFLPNEGDEYPVSGDWKVGAWETAGDQYYARCLVGPDGAAPLDADDYHVWIKVVLSPETVVERVGGLTIY